MEAVFDALFAQHALLPAKTLDAASIATATIAVLVVILFMVKSSDRRDAELFNFVFIGQ